jgi:hypothetical protein
VNGLDRLQAEHRVAGRTIERPAHGQVEFRSLGVQHGERGPLRRIGFDADRVRLDLADEIEYAAVFKVSLVVYEAAQLLDAMAKFSSGFGLIPEQSWEFPDLAASPFGTDPTVA